MLLIHPGVGGGFSCLFRQRVVACFNWNRYYKKVVYLIYYRIVNDAIGLLGSPSGNEEEPKKKGSVNLNTKELFTFPRVSRRGSWIRRKLSIQGVGFVCRHAHEIITTSILNLATLQEGRRRWHQATTQHKCKSAGHYTPATGAVYERILGVPSSRRPASKYIDIWNQILVLLLPLPRNSGKSPESRRLPIWYARRLW